MGVSPLSRYSIKIWIKVALPLSLHSHAQLQSTGVVGALPGTVLTAQLSHRSQAAHLDGHSPG